MRIFAVVTKILGGGWLTFGAPVPPPRPNVEPPLVVLLLLSLCGGIAAASQQ